MESCSRIKDKNGSLALWYDVGGKLLSGIKSVCVESSACVRVKGAESE